MERIKPIVSAAIPAFEITRAAIAQATTTTVIR